MQFTSCKSLRHVERESLVLCSCNLCHVPSAVHGIDSVFSCAHSISFANSTEATSWKCFSEIGKLNNFRIWRGRNGGDIPDSKISSRRLTGCAVNRPNHSGWPTANFLFYILMINPPAVYIYVFNSHGAVMLMLIVWLTVALIQISPDVPFQGAHQKLLLREAAKAIQQANVLQKLLRRVMFALFPKSLLGIFLLAEAWAGRQLYRAMRWTLCVTPTHVWTGSLFRLDSPSPFTSEYSWPALTKDCCKPTPGRDWGSKRKTFWRLSVHIIVLFIMSPAFHQTYLQGVALISFQMTPCKGQKRRGDVYSWVRDIRCHSIQMWTLAQWTAAIAVSGYIVNMQPTSLYFSIAEKNKIHKCFDLYWIMKGNTEAHEEIALFSFTNRNRTNDKLLMLCVADTKLQMLPLGFAAAQRQTCIDTNWVQLIIKSKYMFQ